MRYSYTEVVDFLDIRIADENYETIFQNWYQPLSNLKPSLSCSIDTFSATGERRLKIVCANIKYIHRSIESNAANMQIKVLLKII